MKKIIVILKRSEENLDVSWEKMNLNSYFIPHRKINYKLIKHLKIKAKIIIKKKA